MNIKDCKNGKVVEWKFWRDDPSTKCMIVRVQHLITKRFCVVVLREGEHRLYDELIWTGKA